MNRLQLVGVQRIRSLAWHGLLIHLRTCLTQRHTLHLDNDTFSTRKMIKVRLDWIGLD